MIATDCRRDDCQLGHCRITYAKLQREYRCSECGGRITLKWSDDEDWHAKCGACGSRDFIREFVWLRQKAEAREVLDGLPPKLAAQLK